MPSLPAPRGPISSALIRYWTDADHQDAADHAVAPTLDRPDLEGVDALVDDDLHLALWACYHLHFSGFDDLDDRFEWDPATIAFRVELERAFEAALREEHREDAVPTDPVVALRVMATWAGPPLSSTVAEGSRTMLEEFAVHRSLYQLKEADAHTFGLPRLAGPGRAAMIEIQADEYGNGRPGEAHAELFAAAMTEMGFDPAVAAYVDILPGTTLATDNLVTMFGLNRRLRGALVGHLALFEMCSVVPMGRYRTAARRIGGLPAMEEFYAVHVEADDEHSRLALDEMVAPFAAANPEQCSEVVFGAAALARVEARFARHLLTCWDDGGSSLRDEPYRVLPREAPIVLPAPTERVDPSDAPTGAFGAVDEGAPRRRPPLVTLAS